MDQKPSKNKEESAERTNSAKLVDNIMSFIATVCFAVGVFILKVVSPSRHRVVLSWSD